MGGVVVVGIGKCIFLFGYGQRDKICTFLVRYTHMAVVVTNGQLSKGYGFHVSGTVREIIERYIINYFIMFYIYIFTHTHSHAHVAAGS